MQLTLYDDLPFVSLALTYQGATAKVAQVLIDTGSASTIFAARVVAPIGILPEMTDDVYTVRASAGLKPCLHAGLIVWRLKRRRSMTLRSKSAV